MILRLRTLALAALPLALGAACSFGVDVDLAPGFACRSNDDCVSGYICSLIEDQPGTSEVLGRCVSESVDDVLCADNDGDGFVVRGCPTVPDNLWDCDDTNPNINPGAQEECDGVDNNCNCPGDTNNDGVTCGPGDEGVDENLPPRPCALQAGVCAGATIGCIDGTYPIAQCARFGVYPETFEAGVETLCDGLDNNCNGQVDEGDCDCQLDNTAAIPCGTDAGQCTRGIRVCGDTFTRTGCLEAPTAFTCGDGTPCTPGTACDDGGGCGVQTCTTDDDCTTLPNGFCVEEIINVVEAIDDDCAPGASPSCRRTVCRYLPGDATCDDDSECTDGEGGTCFAGTCQYRNVISIPEICNGLDDDCDGTIDTPGRSTTCAPCPFNSMLTTLSTAIDGSNQVCVDRYEASRPDATADSAGTFSFYAASRPGVQPWTGIGPEDARLACNGQNYAQALGVTALAVAPKLLCNATAWRQACGGQLGTANASRFPYVVSNDDNSYVDDFQPGTCVDATLELDGPQTTASAPACCLAQNAAFPAVEACDLIGNVAEWVRGVTGEVLAGGSYLDNEAQRLNCAATMAMPLPEELIPSDLPTDPQLRREALRLIQQGYYADFDHVGFRCCTQPRR
jgi:hypothetical protein